MSWLNLLLILLLLLVLGGLVALALSLRSLKGELQHQSLDQSYQIDEHFQKESQQVFSLINQVSVLRKQMDQSSLDLGQLNRQMDALSSILAHPKRRGNYGEIQLETIIQNFLGDSSRLFERQYQLENGKIADGVLKMAGRDEVLCIDSKFPLENYVRFEQSGLGKDRAEFLRNMKGHVDAIAQKYITHETMPFALLFLPSEGIYAWLCANEPEFFQYAYGKHVLITSPTTLIGILSTLMASTRDFYQAKNMEHIQEQLRKLQEDFEGIVQPLEKAAAKQRSLEEDLERTLSSVRKVRHDFNGILEAQDKRST